MFCLFMPILCMDSLPVYAKTVVICILLLLCVVNFLKGRSHFLRSWSSRPDRLQFGNLDPIKGTIAWEKVLLSLKQEPDLYPRPTAKALSCYRDAACGLYVNWIEFSYSFSRVQRICVGHSQCCDYGVCFPIDWPKDGRSQEGTRDPGGTHGRTSKCIWKTFSQETGLIALAWRYAKPDFRDGACAGSCQRLWQRYAGHVASRSSAMSRLSRHLGLIDRAGLPAARSPCTSHPHPGIVLTASLRHQLAQAAYAALFGLTARRP